MIIQQKLEFFKHKVHVYLNDETLILKGDVFHLDFEVRNGNGKTIGSVYKKFFALRDSYELNIYDESYTEELIALVICLNNMIDLEQSH